MKRLLAFIPVLALTVSLNCHGAEAAQEVLRPARIQARASRRQPSLGLPKRLDGQPDPAVWHDAAGVGGSGQPTGVFVKTGDKGLKGGAEWDVTAVAGSGAWKGADSLNAVPFWIMSQVSVPTEAGALTPVISLCARWAAERPKSAVDIVWGPFQGGWFVAICKKTHSALGWKSIGFVIPPEGMDPAGRIYSYSKSVNWIEYRIGYDLFPKLPAHLQEIIEEMTATELLCPFQEFDPGLEEGPDHEIDYEWEADLREP